MLVAVALVVLAISLFTIFYILAGGHLPWEETVTKESLATSTPPPPPPPRGGRF